jgi:hypothetical protein
MVGFLEESGIEGATVLEVGGGVGEIQIELLRRGAERSVNLELSPAYEREAERSWARPASRVACGGGCTTSPSILTRSGRPMWSCSIGWCAAIPTTSGCLERPPHALAGCSSSATRAATPFRGRSSPLRTSAFEFGEGNSERSPAAGRDARGSGRPRARGYLRPLGDRLAGHRARALTPPARRARRLSLHITDETEAPGELAGAAAAAVGHDEQGSPGRARCTARATDSSSVTCCKSSKRRSWSRALDLDRDAA